MTTRPKNSGQTFYIPAKWKRPGVTMLRVITFKIDDDLLEKLDDFSRMKGIPRSEVIRKAIEHYLKVMYSSRPEPRRIKLNR